MKRLRCFLLGLAILGVVLMAAGTTLWIRAEYGPVVRNWINARSKIPPGGYMWTWGVIGNAKSEPDEWHFHVIFAADNVANVTLLWKINERILYHRSSADFDETFVVALPRVNASWTWDWLVGNPGKSMLTVGNFTAIHFSINHPERERGSLLLSSGTVVIVSIPIAVAYARRRDAELRPHAEH